VPRLSLNADSIQPILQYLNPTPSPIITAVTYLTEQGVKIGVSVFGKFVLLVMQSAVNEKLIEIFAVTTDKRFSPQTRNNEVYPREGHEGTREEVYF
jgi:hypothetical protein